MEFVKGIFNKLKEAKEGLDESVEEAELGLVKSSTALGIPEDEAEKITELAKAGGSMAGSIGKVGSKVAKIFRDPSAPKAVANRAGKAEDLMKTMDMGKFMKNKEIIGLPGKSQQARLDSLPEEAKQAVLKELRKRGIDPSKLSQE